MKQLKIVQEFSRIKKINPVWGIFTNKKDQPCLGHFHELKRSTLSGAYSKRIKKINPVWGIFKMNKKDQPCLG
jgi:hypothetical protein